MSSNILKNKIFWIVVIVLALGITAGFFKGVFNNKSEVYVEIDFNGEKRAFEGKVINKLTILEALIASSRGGHFDVRYALINDQTDIFKINNLAENNLNRWNFYLNEEKVNSSQIHKIIVKPGDKIYIKYE